MRDILNFEAKVLAEFYHDSILNLNRQVFYNERTNSLISEIAFTKDGNVSPEHSTYLRIKKKGNKLFFYPSWIKGFNKFAKIAISTYEDNEWNLVKEIYLKDVLELSVDLDDLDKSKITSIVVSAQRGYMEGLPHLYPSSILIDDFNNIPENNLFPVIVKDGEIHSGKYLLKER